MTIEGARQITTRVEIPGLPTLLVSGEPWAPEPEVGISWWVVDQLDWRGAYGALTPEQDLLAYEHTRELEDAVVEAFHERRAAERSAMAGGAL